MGLFGNKKKILEKQKAIAKEFFDNERKVFISGEIDNASAYATIMHIMRWYNQDAEKPITIIINSPGGNINSGISIYDVIKSLLCDVYTVCVGSANGLAALLLASGTKGKRLAISSAEVSIEKFEHDKPKDREEANAVRKLIEKVYRDIENETKMSYKQVNRIGIKSLSSDEVLRFGLVDCVLPDDIIKQYVA